MGPVRTVAQGVGEIVDFAPAYGRHHLPHRRLPGVLLTGIVLALSLVSGAGAGAAAAPGPHIAWTPCPTVSGYLCGTLPVPLDYQDPSRGTVNLAVMEKPVPQSKGDIVFNPGGPGESGDLILPILASLMPQALKDQFTFVSFDERGTGSSQPLLCGPSAAAAGSAIAGTAAATRTFAGLERSCRTSDPTLFPTVNTTTSARDMDRLRVALGVERIDYYGMSYGTALGSVYAHLFPSHVRSMVLDGAVDSNLSLVTRRHRGRGRHTDRIGARAEQLQLPAELPAGRGPGRLLPAFAATAPAVAAPGSGRR